MKFAALLYRAILLTVLVAGCTRDPDAPQATATIPAATTVVTTAPTSSSATAAGPTGEPSPIAPVAQTPAIQDGLKTYQNPTFGLSFKYPADWFGPDEYAWESGVRVEIGTDVVYPYGTSLEERKYSQTDAYYIVIDYRKNVNNWTLEQYHQEQPWLDTYFMLLDKSDGDGLVGPRSLVTRVREVQVGKFTGLEYIVTLPDNAQTERVYAREFILFDEDLNLLHIMAQPNNVAIASPANWKADYQRIDQAYGDKLYQVVQSIKVE